MAERAAGPPPEGEPSAPFSLRVQDLGWLEPREYKPLVRRVAGADAGATEGRAPARASLHAHAPDPRKRQREDLPNRAYQKLLAKYTAKKPDEYWERFEKRTKEAGFPDATRKLMGPDPNRQNQPQTSWNHVFN